MLDCIALPASLPDRLQAAHALQQLNGMSWYAKWRQELSTSCGDTHCCVAEADGPDLTPTPHQTHHANQHAVRNAFPGCVKMETVARDRIRLLRAESGIRMQQINR